MAPKRSQKAIGLENVPRPGHKRAKIEDPVGDKVTAISEALTDSHLLEVEGNTVCREMLVTILPMVLKVPRSERHSYQASVASMIEEILNSSKGKWEQKVGDSQVAIERINGERTSTASAREEANLRVKEQEAVVANLKDEVRQHSEAETAAQQVLEKAAKEVREFENVQAGKAKMLEEYNATYKENFEAVQSPSEALSAKDQKTHLSKLTAFLKGVSADASLITALPAVIKKLPADRGAFDSLAVEQVGELLKKNIDVFQSELDSSESLKAQKVEAQTQAQAALDTTKESHKACKDNMKAATEVLMGRQEESKAALKALVSKNTEADNASKQHLELEKGLEKVKNLVSMFEFLIERDVVPEIEPETKLKESSKVDVVMEESADQITVEPVQAMQEVA